MAITEFVFPSLKQDPETATAFTSTIAPFLSNLIDTHSTPPVLKRFGKVVSEDGRDVTGEFRPCLGIEWHHAADFTTLLSTPGFTTFKSLVQPHATAPANPQLYETDLGATDSGVFECGLTEVWQVRVGEGDGGDQMMEEVKKAWRGFVGAVVRVVGEVVLEESGKTGNSVEGIQGVSLNQGERLWIGVLGWEGSEKREKVLESAAVKEAKKGLDALVWKTFVLSFAQ
ncbi:hypothetical protein ONS95_014341 [Cadophora gregata]|uniref:uncharacterized protein n=1 Tax=Cadophora gregata TaxID=51156 RepID=UPI0026DCF406|nr:uncharacterized protein ONS95_014341 [Cadophora gregata]KAK0112598.1 hypothetical protein ONS95_014341 [Cadophora gregata]KAK0124731.1 hypothetical protein ONS96_008614 [Cadophora gregata f. sp. sojae]